VLHHSNLVFVKRTQAKGRGVFARRAIPMGTVIERVPVLVIAVESLSCGHDNAHLNPFFFEGDSAHVFVPLGFGSLYNHSYTPNAEYADRPGQIMLFTSLRDIAKDEEITINYNGDPEDGTPVGFDVL
jgi:uncharacterized protein